MSAENIHQSMTEEDRAKFERGKELLGQVQAGKLFDDFWVPIGAGLIAVRRTVVNALHLKKAQGGHYKTAFSKLCKDTPYGEMHEVERSNLLFCMEHLDDLMEMRSKWEPKDRWRINHPNSIAKYLRAHIKLKQTGGEAKPRKNSNPIALVREENEKLTKANVSLVALVETLKQRDDFNPFDLKNDKPKDIAVAIVANVTLDKANEIRAELVEAIKAKKKAKQTTEKQVAAAAG